MIIRPAILATVTAAGALLATSTAADAALPGGTTAVPVTAGTTTTGIDVTLPVASAVSGRLTTDGGKPVPDARIQLYDAAGKPVNEGDYDGTPYVQGANSDGTYTVPALNAGTYYACARSDVAIDTCYGGAAQSTGHGDPVPAGAKSFTLAAGQHLTGIDITLPKGVAFGGTITAAANSKVHPSVDITVLNRSTNDVETVFTSDPARYSVNGLRPSAKGYAVCFAANDHDLYSDSDTDRYGYLDQCWNRKAWISPGPKPSTAVLDLAVGSVRHDIDAILPIAGAVSGTVRVSGAKDAGTLVVDAYTPGGTKIATTTTRGDGSGRYLLRGLPKTSAVKICVEKSRDVAGGQCFRGTKYTSGKPPASAANVSVALGRTHTGIDFTLTRAKPVIAPPVAEGGTITGTLTGPAGKPATGMRALVYDATTHAFVGRDDVDAKGVYSIGVPPGTYQVCAGVSTDVDVSAATAPGTAPGCRGASWDGGGSIPTGATPIRVAAGVTRTIPFSLPAAGAISGTVTITTGVPYTDVRVYNGKGQKVGVGGQFRDSATGAVSSAYKVIGLLPSSTGYTVCFTGAEPDLSSDGESLGALPDCYKDRVWNIPVPQAEYGSD